MKPTTKLTAQQKKNLAALGGRETTVQEWLGLSDEDGDPQASLESMLRALQATGYRAPAEDREAAAEGCLGRSRHTSSAQTQLEQAPHAPRIGTSIDELVCSPQGDVEGDAGTAGVLAGFARVVACVLDDAHATRLHRSARLPRLRGQRVVDAGTGSLEACT